MYVPSGFEMKDQAQILDLMRANTFAALISADADGLMATHLPTLVREAAGGLVIEAHLARGNPHWRRLAAAQDRETMMIFSGPDAYIRPGWYPSKAEDPRHVPTWNYAIVHAYGRANIIEDGAWLMDHVRALSEQQESPYELPWRTSDAPEGFIAGLTRGIVGLRFEVTRLDAKAKMGQNRSARDALGAVAGLEARGAGRDSAVAAMMRAVRADMIP